VYSSSNANVSYEPPKVKAQGSNHCLFSVSTPPDCHHTVPRDPCFPSTCGIRPKSVCNAGRQLLKEPEPEPEALCPKEPWLNSAHIVIYTA
jgi:hypothetical protein